MNTERRNEKLLNVISVIALVISVIALMVAVYTNLVVNTIPLVQGKIVLHIHESLDVPAAKDLIHNEAKRLSNACANGDQKACDYLDAVRR